MNNLSFLLYIADALSSAVYLGLIIFILHKGKKLLLNRICALLLFCFFAWSLSAIFTRNTSASKSSVSIAYNFGSFGWIGFSSFFLLFAAVFTKKISLLKSRYFYPLIFIPPFLFFYQQWAGILIVDYIKEPYGWSFVWADSIWPRLFYLYYALFMLLGLFFIFSFWLKNSDPIKKLQSRLIFLTTFLTLILGSLTNIALQEFDIHFFPPIANNIVLIWAIGLVYAIAKYKFLVVSADTTADAILSSIPDAMILLDREGKIATVNKVAQDLLGYSKYELENKPFSEILSVGVEEGLLKRILSGESIKEADLKLKHIRSEEVVVKFSSSALNDSKGNMFGVICVVTDLAKRNQVRATLLESEKKYNLIAEHQKNYIIRLDLNRRFDFVSPSLCKLLVKKEEELLGRDFLVFIYERDQEAILEAMERLKRPPYNVYIEHEMMTKYGARWICWTFQSLFDDNNNTTGILGVGEDITERKRSNEALRESEKKFQDLTEDTTDFIWEVNRNWTYTFANSKVKDLLGYDVRVVIGESPFYFLSEEEADRVENFLEEKARNKEPFYNFESVNMHADGYLVVLETSAVPILDESGVLKGYRGISRDVTERKKFDDQLLHAAEEWRTVFDSISDMVILIDKDYRITRMNMAFANAFKTHPKKIVGKFCYKMIYGEDKACIECPHRYVMERGHPQTAELDLTDSKLGIYAQISASPVFGKAKGAVASVCIIKDITQRKNNERDAELTQLAELVSDITLKINDPLMIILGRAQLSLTSDITDEKLKADLKTIIEESESIREVISKLIVFSRPHKEDFKALDVAKCVEAAISLQEPKLKLANINIKRNFASGLPMILGDQRQLQEVIINLLNNAHEAMPKGGLIIVATSLDEKFIKIEIQDNGEGMTKEVLRKISRPFFSTKEKSVGLGLSACYTIIKAHNGQMHFASKPGQGTTVTILLPPK
ncbi:MAG: hypothetical protein DRP74_03270 [Candidatus Omnitrophota bacterium]|nr:MAG: hypothetical protein DRP74_03270 [Candidatus Omnitrophota bacterium]